MVIEKLLREIGHLWINGVQARFNAAQKEALGMRQSQFYQLAREAGVATPKQQQTGQQMAGQ